MERGRDGGCIALAMALPSSSPFRVVGMFAKPTTHTQCFLCVCLSLLNLSRGLSSGAALQMPPEYSSLPLCLFIFLEMTFLPPSHRNALLKRYCFPLAAIVRSLVRGGRRFSRTTAAAPAAAGGHPSIHPGLPSLPNPFVTLLRWW